MNVHIIFACRQLQKIATFTLTGNKTDPCSFIRIMSLRSGIVAELLSFECIIMNVWCLQYRRQKLSSGEPCREFYWAFLCCHVATHLLPAGISISSGSSIRNEMQLETEYTLTSTITVSVGRPASHYD